MKRILILTAILSYVLVTLAGADSFYICSRISDGAGGKIPCRQCGNISLHEDTPPGTDSQKDWRKYVLPPYSITTPTPCPVGDELFWFLTLEEARNFKALNCTCR